MKSWQVLLILAVLGTGVGVALTYVEKHRGAELFFTEDTWTRMREEAAAREKKIDRKTAAKVEVVGDAVFDAPGFTWGDNR